jgi:hypothetical protein
MAWGGWGGGVFTERFFSSVSFLRRRREDASSWVVIIDLRRLWFTNYHLQSRLFGASGAPPYDQHHLHRFIPPRRAFHGTLVWLAGRISQELQRDSPCSLHSSSSSLSSVTQQKKGSSKARGKPCGSRVFPAKGLARRRLEVLQDCGEGRLHLHPIDLRSFHARPRATCPTGGSSLRGKVQPFM